MKKILIIMLLSTVFLICSVNFAAADVVNMNISVNGTSNLNITVDADDTLARQAINQTQTDVYGTMHGSGPRDMILDEIRTGAGNPITTTEGLDNISEVCNDPYLQQWLGQIRALPPLEFANYLKALGYDDEAHINLIWTICQQQYIQQHEGQWSEVGGGIQQGDLVSIFKAAIGYLTGSGDSAYAQARDLAIILDSYFASDKDVWTLSNKVKQLELRIEALERTIEKTSSEEYCESKITMMKIYNLTSVKCGENSTTYWNAKKEGFDNYDMVAYQDCTENWVCTSWGECTSGVQTRKCTDKNDCGTFYQKPVESKQCEITKEQTVESPLELKTQTTKVESYQSIEQLLTENYLPILLVVFIAVEITLVFAGMKKDLVKKFKHKK